MGKLVVTEFVSVDGVFEDPGGSEEFDHGGWSFKFNRGEEGDKFKLDELMDADAQLFGRVTYEGFAEAWPTRTGSFADRINSMPKYVVSSTLERTEWTNSTIISNDVQARVAEVKAQYEGDVLVAGSGQLVRLLLAAGLIDQLHLMVFPVVLGVGRRLFEGAELAELRQIDAITMGECTTLVYGRRS
ncbi:MAG: dihydrofolate reductase [Solirubrobacterales bacterium]|nr:dihydrofolate reductase [Solirubrobacterales bacterium]